MSNAMHVLVKQCLKCAHLTPLADLLVSVCTVCALTNDDMPRINIRLTDCHGGRMSGSMLSAVMQSNQLHAAPE